MDYFCLPIHWYVMLGAATGEKRDRRIDFLSRSNEWQSQTAYEDKRLKALKPEPQTVMLWYHEKRLFSFYLELAKAVIFTASGGCGRWLGRYYLPTPPLGQDMTQGQFLSGV